MTLIELYTNEITNKFNEIAEEMKIMSVNDVDRAILKDIEDRMMRKIIMFGVSFLVVQIVMMIIFFKLK